MLGGRRGRRPVRGGTVLLATRFDGTRTVVLEVLDLARSVGQSLKIFKSEVKDLREDDKKATPEQREIQTRNEARDDTTGDVVRERRDDTTA